MRPLLLALSVSVSVSVSVSSTHARTLARSVARSHLHTNAQHRCNARILSHTQHARTHTGRVTDPTSPWPALPSLSTRGYRPALGASSGPSVAILSVHLSANKWSNHQSASLSASQPAHLSATPCVRLPHDLRCSPHGNTSGKYGEKERGRTAYLNLTGAVSCEYTGPAPNIGDAVTRPKPQYGAATPSAQKSRYLDGNGGALSCTRLSSIFCDRGVMQCTPE
jgi:hypothetical protein